MRGEIGRDEETREQKRIVQTASAKKAADDTKKAQEMEEQELRRLAKAKKLEPFQISYKDVGYNPVVSYMTTEALGIDIKKGSVDFAAPFVVLQVSEVRKMLKGSNENSKLLGSAKRWHSKFPEHVLCKKNGCVFAPLLPPYGDTGCISM